MWTGDEVEHGAAKEGRLQPRNTSDSWALGAGSEEEPQTDVHTLPWAAGSRMGFSQGPRAPSPCFQSVLLLPSPSYLLQEWCRLHGPRCPVRPTTHDMVRSCSSPVNAQARAHVDERIGWRSGRPEKTASSDTVTPGKVADMWQVWQVWQVPGG